MLVGLIRYLIIFTFKRRDARNEESIANRKKIDFEFFMDFDSMSLKSTKKYVWRKCLCVCVCLCTCVCLMGGSPGDVSENPVT